MVQDEGEESQVSVVEEVGQDSCLNEESEQLTIAAVQPVPQGGGTKHRKKIQN